MIEFILELSFGIVLGIIIEALLELLSLIIGIVIGSIFVYIKVIEGNVENSKRNKWQKLMFFDSPLWLVKIISWLLLCWFSQGIGNSYLGLGNFYIIVIGMTSLTLHGIARIKLAK